MAAEAPTSAAGYLLHRLQAQDPERQAVLARLVGDPGAAAQLSVTALAMRVLETGDAETAASLGRAAKSQGDLLVQRQVAGMAAAPDASALARLSLEQLRSLREIVISLSGG